MPVYLGPSDHLVYEGQVVTPGVMVHVQGKELERLKSMGHQFEGHPEPVGPEYVDAPKPASMPIGSQGAALSAHEIAASSSQHIAALHEAAKMAAHEEAVPQPEAEAHEPEPEHTARERAKR